MKNDLIYDEFSDLPSSKKGWEDITHKDHSNKRTQSFKVFVNADAEYKMLHLFSAGEYDKVEYYHIVLENFEPRRDTPVGEYSLKTAEEIKTIFGIAL